MGPRSLPFHREAEIQEQQDIDAVYSQEGARLWRAIFAYTRDREVTDDAVSEAFTQCLHRAPAVRDPRAWVWRAAFRIAAGMLRDRRDWSPLAEDLADDGSDDLTRLWWALGRLSAMQRAVLVLHYYEGYDLGEIADAFTITRGTARVHLSRGRRKLKRELEEQRWTT
jgi:RNA polymerase sigma-70 factor (ECF subfamily)